MTNRDTQINLDSSICKIIEALTKMIAMEQWEKSALLKAQQKTLRTLISRWQMLLEGQGELDVLADKKTTLAETKVEQLKLYILLYQQNALTISDWQESINILPQHLATKQIYEEESHVEEFIRSRPNKECYGYVAVQIARSDCEIDRSEADQLGHPLCMVRSSASASAIMEEFVYVNQRYAIVNGQLLASENNIADQEN